MLTAPCNLTQFSEEREGCKFLEPSRDVKFLCEL